MKWQKGLSRGLQCISIAAFLAMAGHTSVAARSSTLVILQQEDAAPRDARKINERYFTGSGNGNDCSYYQLLLSAQQAAENVGADILKIVSRAEHSHTQKCDGIEVAFYRSGNPRNAEQSFTWDGARRLTWDDFKGGVRRGADDNIAAETSCGIALETSLTGQQEQAKIYVFNTFDKQKSWVREGYDHPDVLQHEQGHWDICELYTRKMQARFDAAHITGANLQREVSRIYEEVSNEYLERQEQYEQETQHGIIETEQNRWTATLTRELSKSSLSKL